MIGLALEPLLFPRTCQLLPSRRAPADLRLPSPPNGANQTSDLAVVWPPPQRPAAKLLERATATARAVLLLSGSLTAADARRQRLEGHLVLGPGGGLWSPCLAAGISDTALGAQRKGPSPPIEPPPSGELSWLILTQGRTMAARLLATAATAGLRLLGAIASGEEALVSWQQLALASLALTPRPGLLIGLHRPPTLSALSQLATACPEALLYLSSTAAPALPLPAALELEPPQPFAMVRAANLALAPSPEVLVAAAVLRQWGVTRRCRGVRIQAETADGKVLLQDALARAGIDNAPARSEAKPARPTVPQPSSDRAQASQLTARHRQQTEPTVTLVQEEAAGPLPRLVLAAGDLAELPELPEHTLVASEENLRGLAVLLTQRAPAPLRRPRALGRQIHRARRLLDAWPAALSEVQSKQLLSCFALEAPAEQLVTSASAAGQAAGQFGHPVAVKATGPGLRQRFNRGCGILPVENAAAARQAFRDVLHACARLDPPPGLDGVLISPLLALPCWLDCGLSWSEGAPPLLLARLVRQQLPPPRPLALLCPAAAADAQELAVQLLEETAAPRPIGAVAELLEQLSWLGPALAERLLWLRLDTVALPPDEGACLVLDARGQQRDSYRNPLG